MPEFNIVLEFDGVKHYTNPKVVIADYKKNEYLINNGYNVIRIPYFVQEFSINGINIKMDYPNGFIERYCILPSEFCFLGLKRFVNDIKMIDNSIVNDIKKSIDNLVNEFGNMELIIPKSIYNDAFLI